MRAAFLVGRMIFGGFFFYNGLNHFKQKAALTQYCQAKNVPNPDWAVQASGATLLAAGASIALGIKPKWGTLGLIGFLAAVSPVMHDFWNSGDPGQSQNDMAHFGKNMALLGAAIALAGIPEPWPLSIES